MLFRIILFSQLQNKFECEILIISILNVIQSLYVFHISSIEYIRCCLEI